MRIVQNRFRRCTHERGRCNRGSAYVFVLGITLIVTVLGMGALAVSRVTVKTVSQSNDWEAAGALAFSATEHAISSINSLAAASPTTWRNRFTSSQIAFTQTVDRGTMKWALKDESDGNFSDDYLESFRIYGIGTVGSVTRVYSVQVVPGGSPLDVLRCGLHTSSTINATANTFAVNGPLSTSGALTISGTPLGSFECLSTSGGLPPGSGSTYTVTTGCAAKAMPSATIYNDLLPYATTIDFDSLSGGTIEKCVLSSTSNPYGVPNPYGIYSLVMGNNKDLKIQNCRIVGTLLIYGSKQNKVTCTTVTWDPPSASYPSMVVSSAGVTVTFNGSNTWLSENSTGVNLNPPGTPYRGATDTDTSDDFPPQYHGIFHIIGGSSGQVTLSGNAYIVGTVVTDCPVNTTGQCTVVEDAKIYAKPPLGYAIGNIMSEVPGSWRWDTLP